MATTFLVISRFSFYFTDGTGLPAIRSEEERCLARDVPHLHAGLVAEQQLHTLHVVMKRCHMQGSSAPVISQVHNRCPKVRDQQFQAMFASLETVSQSHVKLQSNIPTEASDIILIKHQIHYFNTAIFLNQERANVCEHMTKMASIESLSLVLIENGENFL